MNIGLDFMGTIVNHLAAKATFARNAWGLDITETEATREAMKQRLGAEEYRRFTRAFEAHLPELFPSLPLYDDVRLVLTELANEENQCVIVSWQPDDTFMTLLESYVTQHQLPISAIDVVMVNDEEKRDVCVRRGIQIFFDDNRSVLELLRPLEIALVWANFYRRPSGPPDMHIAQSWLGFREITRYIRRAL